MEDQMQVFLAPMYLTERKMMPINGKNLMIFAWKDFHFSEEKLEFILPEMLLKFMHVKCFII